MSSTSEELAERLLTALSSRGVGIRHHSEVRQHLALAVYRGVGVVPMRGSRRLYIVMGDLLTAPPRDEATYPVFVIGERRSIQQISTGDVARRFRRFAKGSRSTRPKDSRGTWAPVATKSRVRLGIYGNVSDPVATTPDPRSADDGGQYEWYDLGDVPEGGVVLRIGPLLDLSLFLRTSATTWATLTMRLEDDAVDVHGIVAAMRHRHGGSFVLEEPVGAASIPLAWNPPIRVIRVRAR